MKKRNNKNKHFKAMLFCKKCRHTHDKGGIYIKACAEHRDETVIHLTHSSFDKSSCGMRYKNMHLTDNIDDITCLECQMKVINELLIAP